MANKIANPCQVVPQSYLTAGDQIVIPSYSIIPCDCYVTEGKSSINQALITGEALPVQKSVWDFLLGGTRNLGKELVAVVHKEQGYSFYSPLVHGAIEATVFVMTLAVVVPLKEICTSAGSLSYEAIRAAMARAMTILTCACPCALGLAIPSAVVAAVDVDIDKNAEKVALFTFLNSGQICLNLKRIFVHRSIYSQFKEAPVKHVKSYALGDESNEGVTHGPLQNAPQFKRVKGFFEDIEKEGWSVAVGGKIESSNGYFVNTTIIDVPPETSRIVVEEPFYSPSSKVPLVLHYGTELLQVWSKSKLSGVVLEYRSSIAAKALLNAGLKHGNAVGIFAGNRFEYIELFLASARIGCPFVVFNTTNSPHELCSAVARSDCKALFIASSIGSIKTDDHVYQVATTAEIGKCLEQLNFLNDGTNGSVTNQQLERAETRVQPSDVLNMQLTSGEIISINEVAFRLAVHFSDIFVHIGAGTDGITASENHNSAHWSRCWLALSPSLMDELRAKMNVQGMLITYGMTETSPVTSITSLDDPDDRMLISLGRVLPHTAAKIVDTDKNIVPIGERGEICTSGFALQKGYYKDEIKTQEAMRRDENGVLRMHTGDEGYPDEEGYGFITGRIKDLIIRGGENLSPSEIENQLLRHPTVREACVVAVKYKIHGEIVAAFLQACSTEKKLSDEDVRDWVLQDLSPVKVPALIFWLGHDGVDAELPKTGSGKYQRHIIRDIANRLAGERGTTDD
ncbi:long-chain-fatty-acid- ligase [Fusarium agapanthi]|uniref:Long-chain-fatty-acid- ligase n=1 Tax=Fusarium agapanthi TaxID=1803897 RepID=A0A9P5B0X3_9HYPO|nr:long-chain-fatty-acid- ligase [Fusarium agapanthi]